MPINDETFDKRKQNLYEKKIRKRNPHKHSEFALVVIEHLENSNLILKPFQIHFRKLIMVQVELDCFYALFIFFS